MARYRLLDALGEGGQGRVVRAVDEGTGALVALKMAAGGSREGIEREYLSALGLRHPAWPRPVDFLTEGPALVLELVAGTPLSALPDCEPQVFPKLAVRLLLALRALHARGLVHGDVTPGNVLVPVGPAGPLPDGARMLDLGLARPFHRASGRTIDGTPGFLAPEQLAGGLVDERSDLHGLGTTLACSLAGGAGPAEARDSLSRLSGPFAAWLRALTADRPGDRPSDCDAALEAGILAGALPEPSTASRVLAPAVRWSAGLAARLVEELDEARAGGSPCVVLTGGGLASGREIVDQVIARALTDGTRRLELPPGPEGTASLARTLSAELGGPAPQVEDGPLDLDRRVGRPWAALARDRPSTVLLLPCLDEADVRRAARMAERRPPRALLVATLPDRALASLLDADDAGWVRVDTDRMTTEDLLVWLDEALGGAAPAGSELAQALAESSRGDPDLVRHGLAALTRAGHLACDPGGRFRLDASPAEVARELQRSGTGVEPPARLVPLLATADLLGAGRGGAVRGLEEHAARAGLPPHLVDEALAAGCLSAGTDGTLRVVPPELAAAAGRALPDPERRALAARLLGPTGAALEGALDEEGRGLLLAAAGRPAEAAEALAAAGLGRWRRLEATAAARLLEAAAEQRRRAGTQGSPAAGQEDAVRARALLAGGDGAAARKLLRDSLRRHAEGPARVRAALEEALSETAEQEGRHEEATVHARRGLELLGSRGDRRLRCDLRVRLALLAARRRDLGAARQALDEAGRLASAAGDGGRQARVLVERAVVELAAEDPGAARQACERALAAAPGDPAVEARATQLLCRAADRQGRLEEAEAHGRRAIDLHRAAGDLVGELNAVSTLAVLLGRRGRADRAAEAHRRVLQLARRVGEPAYEASTLHHLGLHAYRTGCWPDAEEHLRAAAEAFRRWGERPELEATSLRVLGTLQRDRGELDAAEETFGRVEELIDASSALTPLLHRARASLALERDDAAEAADLARAALRRHEDDGDTEGAGDAHRILAEALSLRGHHEEALAEAERAVSLLSSGHPLLHARALIARALARSLAPLETDGGSQAGDPARSARVDEDFDEAQRLQEEAGAAHEEALGRLVRARALLDGGRARLRGRGAAQLQDSLRAARSVLERLGARRHLARALALSERAESTGDGTRTLATLYEVARVLNASLDGRRVLEEALDLLLPTLDVERAAILLVEGEGPDARLRVAASRDVDEATGADALGYSRTVVFDVRRRGEPLVSPDACADPRFAESRSVVQHAIRSLACVPLRSGSSILGAVYVDDRRALRRFGEDDVRFLEAFADVTAPALQNARLMEELRDARDRLEAEALDLRQKVRERFQFEGMVGESRALTRVQEAIQLVADSTASVLVTGENGTGKELVARAIHAAGRRRDGPFVAVNCAALPETLLESELFGIEKGTATGVTGKVGKFEQADGGVLFLDEIGDMSVGMQARLLRVLQERAFHRVGGDRLIRVDVHVVAATNLDLEGAVREKTFREDLYYRLNVVPIVVPPLRDRREDIPLLLDHFMEEFGRELPPAEDGGPAARPRLSSAARDLLVNHRWPGNVRQLRNLVHRLVLLFPGRVIQVEDLPPELRGEREEMLVDSARDELTMADMKRRYARLVLARCGGNKRKTARTLGIAFKTLQGYLGEA